MEPGSPSATPLVHQYEEDFAKLSISELISILRTAFQTDEFDRVEEALISKELKMKREIEDKTKKLEALNSKAELAMLAKMSIEEEMEKQQEQLKKQLKEGKAAEERYDIRMGKFKGNGPEDRTVIDELTTKIHKLEDEKQMAESMIVHWKIKVADLNKRVSRLEDEIKLMMNGDYPDIGVNSERDSRANTTTRVVNEEKETLSPSHRNGCAHFPSVIVVDSDEDGTSIQGKDATAEIVAENGKGGGSTGAVQQEHGIGMLKRKLASTSPLHCFGLQDTDSSSSSSDSDSDGDFDMDQIPLNGHCHLIDKRRKIN